MDCLHTSLLHCSRLNKRKRLEITVCSKFQTWSNVLHEALIFVCARNCTVVCFKLNLWKLWCLAWIESILLCLTSSPLPGERENLFFYSSCSLSHFCIISSGMQKSWMHQLDINWKPSNRILLMSKFCHRSFTPPSDKCPNIRFLRVSFCVVLGSNLCRLEIWVVVTLLTTVRL